MNGKRYPVQYGKIGKESVDWFRQYNNFSSYDEASNYMAQFFRHSRFDPRQIVQNEDSIKVIENEQFLEQKLEKHYQEKIEEIIKEKDLEFMKRREKIRRDELDLLEKFLDLDKKHEEALDTIQRLENDLNQNKLRNRRLNNELEKRLENANSAIKKLADHSAYYENGKKYWQIRLPNQEVYDLLGKK